MNVQFSYHLLMPVLLLCIQSYAFLFAAIYILKKTAVISTPFSEMDISQVIFASSMIFGIFYISTANFNAFFQAFRTFEGNHSGWLRLTFTRFGEYFILLIGAETLFVLFAILNAKLLPGLGNLLKEIKEGDVHSGILLSVISISLSVIIHFIAVQVIDYITPKMVIFN